MMAFFFYVTLKQEKMERSEFSLICVIYFDIDGTLRDEVDGIPVSTVVAIQECHQRGIRVILCTGRSVATIQRDVWALKPDGVISSGGCVIRYQDHLLRQEAFSIPVLSGILEYSLQQKIFLSLETEQQIYMDQDAAAFYEADFAAKLSRCSVGKRDAVSENHQITYCDNMDDFCMERHVVQKVCAFGSYDVIKQLQRHLRGRTQIIQMQQWHGVWYLELLPKGCDKGTAVQALNNYLHVEKKQTMSFGDGENDIAMLQKTGIGIVVGNGSSKLQPYAAAICEPIAEDGIYKELVRRKIIGNVNSQIEKENMYNEKAMVAKRSGLSNLSQELLR